MEKYAIFMPLTSVTRNMSEYYFLHESYVFVTNYREVELLSKPENSSIIDYVCLLDAAALSG
jgi:hypothetical protein